MSPSQQPSIASCWGLGHRVGCVLAFCVAFGFGCSAFAVVSFALVFGSRSVLVWFVPCGGGYVCPQCWFAFGVGFGRPAWRWFRLSQCRFALGVGFFVHRVWCLSAFGVGRAGSCSVAAVSFAQNRISRLILVVLRVWCFRLSAFLVRVWCWLWLWRFASVFVVFTCGGVVSFVPWGGAPCRSTQAEKWEVRVGIFPRLMQKRNFLPNVHP